MAIGGLCLLGVIAALVTGLGRVFIPQLVAGAVVLGIAVAFETWRYKRVAPRRIDPRWQDTGERFIDPETGQSTAVYFDPSTAERHYVGQPRTR